jgi:hypothetical protein
LLDKPAELVEQALELIEQGAETFSSCAVRFGLAWQPIENEVAMALELSHAGKQHRLATQNFDKAKVWRKIQPQLEKPFAFNGAADSGSNPDLNVAKIIKFAPAKPTLKRQIWMRVAAVLLIFVLLSTTFVNVAQASEPGDWLYDTKLTFDQAGEITSFNQEDKAIHWLDFSGKRLGEIERRVSKVNYNGLDKAISAYKPAVARVIDFRTAKIAEKISVELNAQQMRLNQLVVTANLSAEWQIEFSNLAKYQQTQLARLNKASINVSPNPTPTLTPVPVATVTALPTATPATVTLVPATATVAPTVTNVPTNPPTETVQTPEPVPTSTGLPETVATVGQPQPSLPNTVPPLPTATPVPVVVPPTAVPVPATAVPVPLTNTPLPATATPLLPTNTPLPATATPVPPTAVPPTTAPEPTATPAPPTNTPLPPTTKPDPGPPRTPPGKDPTPPGVPPGPPKK